MLVCQAVCEGCHKLSMSIASHAKYFLPHVRLYRWKQNTGIKVKQNFARERMFSVACDT